MSDEIEPTTPHDAVAEPGEVDPPTPDVADSTTGAPVVPHAGTAVAIDDSAPRRRPRWLVPVVIVAALLIAGAAVTAAVAYGYYDNNERGGHESGGNEGNDQNGDRGNGDHQQRDGGHGQRNNGDGHNGDGHKGDGQRGERQGRGDEDLNSGGGFDQPQRQGQNGYGNANGPIVVPGGGANGEDIVVWPDGRIVPLPKTATPTTTVAPAGA